jgi:hypothetical protein
METNKDASTAMVLVGLPAKTQGRLAAFRSRGCGVLCTLARVRAVHNARGPAAKSRHRGPAILGSEQRPSVVGENQFLAKRPGRPLLVIGPRLD